MPTPYMVGGVAVGTTNTTTILELADRCPPLPPGGINLIAADGGDARLRIVLSDDGEFVSIYVHRTTHTETEFMIAPNVWLETESEPLATMPIEVWQAIWTNLQLGLIPKPY
jgi:hypothetical protein